MEVVYPPVIAGARLMFALQGLRFRLRGVHQVPRRGGVLMAVNHTSYYDFMCAGLAARPSRRLVRFMAKQSIFQHRVTGPLMRGMRHIPVDRRAGAASLQVAVEALRAGEVVGVFPEATMSRSFELKEFKSGTVRIAQAAGVPILPTTIWGAQRVWTKDQRRQLGRRGIPVFITVGEPFLVTAEEGPAAASARLRDVMARQLHEDQADYPPVGPTEQIYLPARLGGAAPTPQEAHRRDEFDRTRTTDRFNS